MTPEGRTPEAVTEHLLGLLPVHVRARDEQTGGLLRALLGSVAAELGLLEADIQELYDSWFIETCPEWVVPYLADLVGLTDLPDLGAGAGSGSGSGSAVSRRAVVANTVAYRRRKGTAAVIEQVVRDVTGWPCRAVEYYRLLAASTHLNHVHTERPASASLRGATRLELVPPEVARGALDMLAHTAEARHIASGRGRYGIPSIGVFTFPLQVYGIRGAAARKMPAHWTLDPLGWKTPLFAEPAREAAIEHQATEPDLPVPLRPRRLLALLQEAREDPAKATDLPLAVRLEDGNWLEPLRLRVCGLEDLARKPDGEILDGPQVMVDAVNGTLRPYPGKAASDPASVHVRYAYASSADVGAGPYERSEIHEAVLAADPYAGDLDDGGRRVRAQSQVLAGGGVFRAATTVAQGLSEVEAAWADPHSSPAGGTYVLSIGDSETYPQDLSVHIPAQTRLVMVAASWRGRTLMNGTVEAPVPGVYSAEGLRPHLGADLTVTGAPGSSLVIDGVVLEGDLVVAPGFLGSLAVSQSTIGGRVVVKPSSPGPNRDLAIAVVRSIVGGVEAAGTVPGITLRDSIIDRSLKNPASTGPALAGSGVHLCVEGSTVRGPVQVRELDASSSIFDGLAEVEQRQAGCIRFSYVGTGSRVPRRFHCVPEAEDVDTAGPVYASAEPGSPYYLALAPACPANIREGGEEGAEMGVHHHLRRPLRLQAAQRLAAPYVPVGLEIGMLGS